MESLTMNPNTSTTTSTKTMNATDQLYQILGNGNFSSILAMIVSVKLFLALIGIIGNGSLVFVTIKNSKMRQPFNVIIAANAFSMALNLANVFITFCIVWSGVNVIPLGHCVYLQLLFNSAILYQFFFFLLTAVDRLVGVLWPVGYMHGRTKTMFIITVLAYTGYVIYRGYSSYMYCMNKPLKYTMCFAPDVADPAQLWQSISLNIFSLVCYIILGLILLQRFEDANQFTRRIMRSLTVSFVVEFFGWLTNNIVRFMLTIYAFDQITKLYIDNVAANVLIVFMDLYPVVFYVFSTDYRQAFLATFGHLLPCCKKSTGAIMPTKAWT